MKILVAGGAGFIGSHLCARLLDDGHAVLCLDNLITGSRANILSLCRSERFTFRPVDITTLDLDGMTVTPDAIFHLASPASPKAYLAHPFETIRANTEGTLRLLELARRDQAKFLFASTSEAYGDPFEHPQCEAYTGNVHTTGPRACYDEAKRLGETITAEYVRQYGTDARIVRIFNTYGPRMQADDGRMIPTFIRQALAGEHLSIHGTGEQTRSLCYVSDTVEGLIRAQFTDATTGEIINIGNPDERSVMAWADCIIRLSGTDAPIMRGVIRPTDDPERRCPAIRKAQHLLDWTPQVTPEEGIKQTIAWYRARMKASVPRSTTKAVSL